MKVKDLKKMLEGLEKKGYGDDTLWSHERGSVYDSLVRGINIKDDKIVISTGGTIE